MPLLALKKKKKKKRILSFDWGSNPKYLLRIGPIKEFPFGCSHILKQNEAESGLAQPHPSMVASLLCGAMAAAPSLRRTLAA
jgi:hypothetical protein